MARTKSNPKNYQQMSAELTEIIDWFESDDVNLDEAVVKYEQALKLTAEIESYLKTAENKIRRLNSKFKP